MNNKTLLKDHDNSNSPIKLSETSANSSIHVSYSYDCTSSNRHSFYQTKKRNEALANANKKNEIDHSNMLSSQDYYYSITNSDENYFSNYSTETKSYVLHSDSEVSIKKRKQNQNICEKKNFPLPRYISSNNGPTESLPLHYAEKSNIADSKYWDSIKTTDSCPEYLNSKEMPKFTHVVERPSSCCLLL